MASQHKILGVGGIAALTAPSETSRMVLSWFQKQLCPGPLQRRHAEHELPQRQQRAAEA